MSGRELTLWTWFRDRSALTPDRVAIDFNGRQITYHELALVSQHRASELTARGCVRGDRVATLARSSPEQVELFFACSIIGAILVPLNRRLSAPELAWQLGDAEPSIFYADDASFDLASAAANQSEWDQKVDRLNESLGGGIATAMVPVARDDDAILLIYTSGTTGRPKGAMISHANCFWTNISLDRTAEIHAEDVVLQVLPQCHVGGWNVQPLLAWWKGATVVLEREFDAARVLRVIAEKGITTMMGVPTNYLLMARDPSFADADLGTLRQMIVGGAPMPETLLDTWLSRGVTILQGYGLTEAAPNVLCVPPEYAKQKVGSAGRPYLHVRVALRRGEEVIDGVATGELIVAGPNVFLGYWNNSEATSMVVRDGWLATGDVAARDEDGFYWMKGRLKDMYISGGENVYPAEIEQVLSSNPAIAVAAVVSVPHDQWGETGYAFVVLENGEHVSIDELTAYCRDSLASFKVPQWISIVEDLPLLGSGKVDKVRLSAKAQGESV